MARVLSSYHWYGPQRAGFPSHLMWFAEQMTEVLTGTQSTKNSKSRDSFSQKMSSTFYWLLNGLSLEHNLEKNPRWSHNYFGRYWSCMLLPRKMDNKVSTAITKGTKMLFQDFREAECFCTWNTVCNSNYFTWRKMRRIGKGRNILNTIVRGIRSGCEVTLYMRVCLYRGKAWKDTLTGICRFFKFTERPATFAGGDLIAWKGEEVTFDGFYYISFVHINAEVTFRGLSYEIALKW